MLRDKNCNMKQDNVFVVSRRAWQEDDLEYGTYEIIYVSLKEFEARKLYRQLKKMAITSENSYYKDNEDMFEYQKGHWFYQYKIEGFVLDIMKIIRPEK